MKFLAPPFNPFKFALLVFATALFVVTSCSDDTDELLDQEIAATDAVEENTEDTPNEDTSDDDTANDDTSNDENVDEETPDDDTTSDPDIPETGAVTFEQDFILDASRTVANFVLPQADYDQFLAGQGSLTSVTEKAYQYLNDDFDFIIILSVEVEKPTDLFYGRLTPVQNQVQGLGSNTYNNSAAYGSSGKLKGIIYMPKTEYIRSGPFLHEIAHTWSNKGLIPTTVGGHWGFASTAGQLGGFDEIEELGNNTYRGKLNGETGFGTFANGGNSIVYGDLELYAMGLLEADDVAPIQVAVNPEWTQTVGEFTADTIETYSIQDMIAQHGTRMPSVSDSQKAFKALTVVISTEAISQVKLDEVVTNLDNFSRQGNPDNSWGSIKNFWQATKEKATFQFDVAQESIK